MLAAHQRNLLVDRTTYEAGLAAILANTMVNKKGRCPGLRPSAETETSNLGQRYAGSALWGV